MSAGGAIWACRQGRVRGSLEALSGPRKGSEGSGDSCSTLYEWGLGQFGLLDKGGLGAACRPSRGRERNRRRVGIHTGPLVSAGRRQFELVDRGGLGAAWRPSRAERGVRGEWDSCWTFCEWVSGQFGLVDSGGLGAAWSPSQGEPGLGGARELEVHHL